MEAATRSLSATPTKAERAAPWALTRDYLALTRPTILAAVLLTAPPALLLGNPGRLSLGAAAAALLAIALVGAGASALNAWWERERDARMARTRERPLPAGRLSPSEALGFGAGSAAAGLALLGALGGPLPVALGAATIAHYLLVYTAWLKPRAASNTVVGALAGAAAPLIADSLDGRIGFFGVALYAIVFAWQPPHVWAIALYRREEYAAAGFSMLPEVAGARGTRLRQLAWVLTLVPTSLLPLWGGALGAVYAAVALLGGAAWCAAIVRALRSDAAADDRRVFRVSLAYLASLFLAMNGELAWRLAAPPLREALPHLAAALDAAVVGLLLAGLAAIRRGNRVLHRRCMLAAVATGLAFVAAYVLQRSLVGERRLPGDDGVRALFLAVLWTHTAAALAVVPLVARVLWLARRERTAGHRRWARIAWPVWLYVAVTGLLVYWLSHHLRPPG